MAVNNAICVPQCENKTWGPAPPMRRWFELGELEDTTYASKSGDIQFLQLPQKAEFIKWANSLVGVFADLTRVVTPGADVTLCDGINAGPNNNHVIHHVSGVEQLSAGGELRGAMLFAGISPVYQGLVRQYFEKPGRNDGPNDTQTVEKPRIKAGGAGSLQITLKSYLLLLLQTWQGVKSGVGGKNVAGTGNVPQRWIEWLTLLINHYSRYTPSQIYGFLARVDFAGPTFKV